MFRLLKRMPLLRLIAIANTVLLARAHVGRLKKSDRRRLGELVRRGPGLSRAEREELRRLLGKLEPRAFAFATADAFSPVPLPRRLAGSSK
jgi:hypothetical protein